MKAALALIAISTVSLLLGVTPVLALDPSSTSASTRTPRGQSAKDFSEVTFTPLPRQGMDISGSARNSACCVSMATAYPLATTRRSESPGQRNHQAARHKRRDSLDWHIRWPCQLEWRAS